MKLIKFFLLLLIIISMVSCSKNDNTIDPNYPTKINTLTSAAYDQLLIDLSETSLYQCTSIDSFGHCYVSLKNKSCGHFDSVYVNYSRQELSNIFYESLLKYNKFINITDTSGITISSIKNHKSVEFDKFKTTYPDSATEGWIISSNLQKLNGYEIPGTEIKVDVFFDQVRSVEGKRYNELYIPPTDKYSDAQAKASILNKEYTYNGSTLKISSSTYWNESQKIIFPISKGNTIELRVCWALHPGNWQVVIDTQNGEVLSYVKI
jgi:hypothetical protein